MRGAQHGGTSARQRRFRRHQREPHHQRRNHAAGERRQITDQCGEDRQRRRFQRCQGDRGESQQRQGGGCHQTGKGDRFRGVGPPDKADKSKGQYGADGGLACLHGDEQAALGRLIRLGGDGFFSVNIHYRQRLARAGILACTP